MNDEYQKINENKMVNETEEVNELNQVKESSSFFELTKIDETNGLDKEKVIKKTSNNFNLISVTLISIVGLLTILSASAFKFNNEKIQFEYNEITDTTINFSVFIESDIEKKYKVSISGDKCLKEFDGKIGKNNYTLTSLEPDSLYTISVKTNNGFGEQTVKKDKTFTIKEINVTKLKSVIYQCKCNFDGMFHFQLNYQDANQNWSNFEAKLTNESGDSSTCIWTSDYHQEQTIDVTNIPGGVYKLTITVVDFTDIKKIIYECEVEI